MKFHCNHCFTKSIDNEGSIYHKYFQTNRADNYITHIESKKHLKCVETIKMLPKEKTTTCACCGKTMSTDAYYEHYKRNNILIDWYNLDNSEKTGSRFGKHHYYDKVFRNHYTSGEITCDSFIFSARRFEYLQEYLDFIVERKKYILDSN